MRDATNAAQAGGKVAAFLSTGGTGDGHRSHARAAEYVDDIGHALGLTPAQLDRLRPALTSFAAEVILGAGWYTTKYRSARRNAVGFILLNAAFVVLLPLGIAAIGNIWGQSPNASASQYSVLISQLTAVLTGIFALQKTISAWYAQQQNYAGWYKCGADLKEL